MKQKHPHRIAANIFFALIALPVLGLYTLYFSKSFTTTETLGFIACNMLLVMLLIKFQNSNAELMSPQLSEPFILLKLFSYALLFRSLIDLMISSHWAWWILALLIAIIIIAWEMFGELFKEGNH